MTQGYSPPFAAEFLGKYGRLMDRTKFENNTVRSGLRASVDLVRPYGRMALFLAIGISLLAVIDVLAIGLVFPMFVSLLQDEQPHNENGILGGFLVHVGGLFPGFSTSGILVALFLFATCLQAALHVLIRRATVRLQWRARHNWATAMMEGFMTEDRVRRSERQLGDQLERMFAQTRLAATCLCQMIQFFACALNLLVLYVLVCLIHWQLAAAFLAGTVVLALVTGPFWSRFAMTHGIKQVTSTRKSSRIALENLMAARDIQAFGIERDRIQVFGRQLDEAHEAATKQTLLHSLADPMGMLVLSLSVVLVVITCRWAFPGEPSLVVPVVGFGLLAVRRLQTLTLTLASHGISVAGMLPSVALVHEELGRQKDRPRVADSAEEGRDTGVAPSHTAAQAVTVRDLCFGYAGKPPLIEPASFTIPARAVTLLVGQSGNGKSTLADLLMGNLTRGSGEIDWGAASIDEMKPAEWRRRVGYVGEESYLFNTTVRENLLIARNDASDAEIIAACRTARAGDFIEQLPAGLDTVVGERGLSLSAGQRQRLAIARVLLRDPPFLIFDEATNALDSANSNLVWQAIDALRTHKTILVITHQPELTVRPDVVLCLRDRRITTLENISALSNLATTRGNSEVTQRCA